MTPKTFCPSVGGNFTDHADGENTLADVMEHQARLAIIQMFPDKTFTDAAQQTEVTEVTKQLVALARHQKHFSAMETCIKMEAMLLRNAAEALADEQEEARVEQVRKRAEKMAKVVEGLLHDRKFYADGSSKGTIRYQSMQTRIAASDSDEASAGEGGSKKQNPEDIVVRTFPVCSSDEDEDSAACDRALGFGPEAKRARGSGGMGGKGV